MSAGQWSEHWEDWFSRQYDLNEQIDRAVTGLSKDKGDGFRVALYAALIEHAAEKMRTFIADVALAPAGEQS